MRLVSIAAPLSHSQTCSGTASATPSQFGTGSPSAVATPSSTQIETQRASGAATSTQPPSQSPTQSFTQSVSPNQGATPAPQAADTAPGAATLLSAGLIAGAVVGASCAAAAVALVTAVYVTRRRPSPPRGGFALALATCCGAFPLRRRAVMRGYQVEAWAGPEAPPPGAHRAPRAIELAETRFSEAAASVSDQLLSFAKATQCGELLNRAWHVHLVALSVLLAGLLWQNPAPLGRG